MTGAGTLVATLRSTVYSMIAEWLEEDVIPEALAALAASVPSLGSSIGAFVAWLTGCTAVTAARIQSKIDQVMLRIAQIARRLRTLAQRASAVHGPATTALKNLNEAAGKAKGQLVAGVATTGKQVYDNGQAGGPDRDPNDW